MRNRKKQNRIPLFIGLTILFCFFVDLVLMPNLSWATSYISSHSGGRKDFMLNLTRESFNESDGMNKTIWLLWFQGWENAPHLQKKMANSWEKHNPGWNIIYLDETNLKDYLPDVGFIYDTNKDISYQAKSDIIRLELLNKYGGVWADSTTLCMQPLDNWIEPAIKPSGFWMYHGRGAGMDINDGPASWFIVSKRGSYIVNKWKEACCQYWESRHSTDDYFWMDGLFRELFDSDPIFRSEWANVPFLSCEEYGSSHTLATHGVFGNDDKLKRIFKETPPYILKFWNRENERLSNCETDHECLHSHGYYAIEQYAR